MTPAAPDTEAQDARAQRDGCGCPDFVLRCGHWDGQVLRLVGNSAAKLLHDPRCRCQLFGPNYTVADGGQLGPAMCGCDMENFWNASGGTRFDTLPAAEAEFARRERELLGRIGA